jgi:hypothetical protein
MLARGFDGASPVVFGCNGKLTGGAHRLASALALGIDVAVKIDARPGKAAAWGELWFRRRGMPAADIARVRADFEALAK